MIDLKQFNKVHVYQNIPSQVWYAQQQQLKHDVQQTNRINIFKMKARVNGGLANFNMLFTFSYE